MRTKKELEKLGYTEEVNAFRKGESFYCKCDKVGCENYLDITNNELAYLIYGKAKILFCDLSFCSFTCLKNVVGLSEVTGIEAQNEEVHR